MNRKHLFKKVIAFMIVLISTLTLVACKKDTPKIPYGSLDDTVFLSGDGYSITKKQLYKEMRTSDLEVLEKLIYQVVMDGKIEEVLENREQYKDDFIKVVNNKIFYTDDIEALKELEDDVVQDYVSKFVDLLYLEGGIDINPIDVDIVEFTEHSQVIFDYYILDVAKRVYAKELLDEEVLDEDSNYYIDKDEDIPNYYENNIKKRYPLSSINIRFTNSYEANQTLRHFNLKTYRSKWYEIEDPRFVAVSTTSYAYEVLESLGLEGKNGSLSESEHQQYYDKYVVNPSREPSENADVSLTLDEVVQTFFEIYNFVYPYKTALNTALTLEEVLADETLVNDDEDNLGVFTKLYSDYPTAQSSLRTYIYDTLGVDENDTRYTASPRSYGSYYFITFKLADHNEDILEYIDEDDELIIYTDEDKTTLTDYAQEYFDKLLEGKLSSTYIEAKFKELVEESKIVVYDELIYLHLNQRDFKVTQSKKNNNNVVLKVDATDILVDDYYGALESKIGATIAMDLALNEILFNSEYADKITSTMRAEYKENIENVIRQFSQNVYESSGFPASMGRKNFLRLSFGSDSIEEAIDRVYVKSELERLFYLDYEKHFGEDVYQIFTDLANRAKDQYFTISTSHLLIYVDMDEDDEPDSPEEFFETLTETQVLEYKDMVVELMQLIHDRASRHATFADGLRRVVDEFNDSTKFRTDLCDAEENAEYRPECTWAEYKQYGFFLKYEDLGSTQNTTNYPTSSSRFDQKFFDRLQYLHEEVKEEYYEVDEKFPTQLLDDRPVTYDGDEESNGVLETSFGWHLVLVTGGDVSLSAEFTYEDDKFIDGDDEDSLKIYEKIIVKDRNGEEITLNAYSEDEYLSLNQVRIFLYESTTDRGIVSIPSDILTVLNSYLAPIKTQYENSHMKMYLLFGLLSESNYEYANAQHNAKLAKILEVNERQFLNYSVDDELYLDMYGDWFTMFSK